MNSYVNLQNKIYTNYKTLILGVINELQQIKPYITNNLIIQRIADIITRMNKMITDNNKNFELLRVEIQNINNNINKQFQQFENKSMAIREIRYDNGRKYIGQILNGLPEGRGTWYVNNGDRYEGEFKKGIYDGKGIWYSHDGRRYEGDFKNDKQEGKGIMFYNDGNRYEGEWKNGKFDGKGIIYYNNGDREIGDWCNDTKIGKHVILNKNGEVKVENY